MDLTTILGVALGIACIVLGQTLEGGNLGSIVQFTAAVIVLGGTAGAVVTQFPLDDLRRGLREARGLVRSSVRPLEPLVARLVALARVSRRDGLLALEAELERTDEPFLRRAISGLIDGSDAVSLRGILQSHAEREEQYRAAGPRIFEAAGGYAPTIGILGAVLGLIHVMENLSDPALLGAGIAVAFVATVYGVGSANLLFLPFAQKLAAKIEFDSLRHAVIIEGVCAIQEGSSPQWIERRLGAFLETRPKETRRAPPAKS
jgi:chemotaxis protein MotA